MRNSSALKRIDADAKILLEMPYRGGPGNWQQDGGTLQQPGQPCSRPRCAPWSETMLQLPADGSIGQLNMKQPGGWPNLTFERTSAQNSILYPVGRTLRETATSSRIGPIRSKRGCGVSSSLALLPVRRKRRAAAHATWPPGRPLRVGETDWCSAPTAGNRALYSRRTGAHRRRARTGRPASCAAAAGSGETRRRVHRDRRTPPLAFGRGAVPGLCGNNLGPFRADVRRRQRRSDPQSPEAQPHRPSR